MPENRINHTNEKQKYSIKHSNQLKNKTLNFSLIHIN
jgi:hypothetical protein